LGDRRNAGRKDAATPRTQARTLLPGQGSAQRQAINWNKSESDRLSRHGTGWENRKSDYGCVGCIRFDSSGSITRRCWTQMP